MDATSKSEKMRDLTNRIQRWQTSQSSAEPLPYTYGLSAVSELIQYTKISTLVPLVPFLLNLKGKPYVLDGHFPMEPLFKCSDIPPRSLLKCGRQVSKSTTLAAQMIVQSAITPYLNTICVAPLFEQIRRFSNNVVRPFIEESPIRPILIGSGKKAKDSSVFQRTFQNGSNMFFTFAFLDAERVRGIAGDCMVADESVCLDSTNTFCYDRGYVKLSELKPGDKVLSFNLNGGLEWDTVVKFSDHGYRHCFTFKLSNGRSITCTDESWLATSDGWLRASQVIERLAASNGIGDLAGGRMHGVSSNVPKVSKQTGVETARIQLSQIPDLVRVRTYSAQTSSESRLRSLLVCLGDVKQSSVRLLQAPLLPARSEWPAQEISNPNVAGPTESSGVSVLAHGRWQHLQQNGSCQAAHGRLLSSGESDDFSVLPGEVEHRCSASSVQRLLRDPYDAGFIEKASEIDITIRDSVDELQGYVFEGDARGKDLLVLRSKIFSHRSSEGSIPRRGVLQPQRMSVSPASKDQPQVSEGAPRTNQKGQQTSVLCRHREEPITRQIAGQKSVARQTQGEQATLPSEATCKESCYSLDLPMLRVDLPEGGNRHPYTILPEVSPGGDSKAESRIGATPPQELQEADILSVEYAGIRHVGDIETSRNNSFIANGIAVHNCQDIDSDHLPVIESCLSASNWGMIRYSGTPKSSDNTIHYLWDQSSQAHWVTRCPCGTDNIAGLEFGLDDMIQPDGFCCKKCMKPLNPADGFFYHMFKDRIPVFPSYHIPQPILPMHHANPMKWYDLYHVKKMNWPRYRYLNEVLGESCDVGSRLVSRQKLISRAILPWRLDLEEARAVVNGGRYEHITMGIDWGGGGGGELKRRRGQLVVASGTTSFTVIAIVGLRNGTLDPELIYAERLPMGMSPPEEAKRVLALIQQFRPKIVAHDYGGAGALRETILLQAGLRAERLMPCTYVRTSTKPIVTANQPDVGRSRWSWSLDKARSLSLICAAINNDMISFPKWPAVTEAQTVLYEDFLSLIEDKIENPGGSDVYRITKNPKQPDDFCHALNYACMAHWHSLSAYPDIAAKLSVDYGSEDGWRPPHDDW